MFGTQHNLLLLLVALSALICLGLTEEVDDNIKEDIIKIENKTQKVIRVNPFELPIKQDRTGAQMNSELIQIQPLRPRQRQYMDSKRMRSRKLSSKPDATGETSLPALKYTNTPELKAFPKQKLKMKRQKQLRFPLDTDEALPVQMTPGEYPIYYVVSKTNGRFGKFPIKSFQSPAQFRKYLIKSKAEPIPRSQRFELEVKVQQVPNQEGSTVVIRH